MRIPFTPLMLAAVLASAPVSAQTGDRSADDAAKQVRDVLREMRDVTREVTREVTRALGREMRGGFPHGYQGKGGPEQTERFSRKVKLGRDGRVSISNIAGDVVVTAGSGDEVSIEAVKRARTKGALADVRIDVDERPGRVDVRAMPMEGDVSVDFTLAVPASSALDLHSISGSLKVTGIQGTVRLETVSGDVTASGTPRLDRAKSVSGDVDVADASADGDVSVGSISGSVNVRGLKSRGLDLNTISGDVTLANVTCDRMGAKSISGGIDYHGTLTKNGRYEVNSHSGTVRLNLAGATGFELTASSFSGSIRSELPLTIRSESARDEGGRRRGMNSRSMQATFGDGSAVLILRTFSGDVVISKVK